MNREIKFRAWDDKAKHMFSPSSISWKNGTLWVCDAHGDNKLEYELVNPDARLMQFTGLRDKNGKEIYEGDILESRENGEVYRVDDMLPAHRHSHITNIGYFTETAKKKTYHTRVLSAAYDNLDDWMSWPEMYEIIGNIFENPELLSNPQ